MRLKVGGLRDGIFSGTIVDSKNEKTSNLGEKNAWM